MMFWNRKSKVIADIIGEAIADNLLLWCEPKEFTKFKEEFNFEEDNKNIDLEYFCLVSFLQTFACQIAFIKNKKFTNEVLDSFHRYIFGKKYNFPFEILEAKEIERTMRSRYAQYYNLSRTKEHNIDISFLIQQLPYDFFANVLEKDLSYRQISKEIDVTSKTISFTKRGFQGPTKRIPKENFQSNELKNLDRPKKKIFKYPTYTGRGRWRFLNNY